MMGILTMWTAGIMEFFVQQIKDQQNIFYLFSSAAQTVATFVAFLIAGYSLVHQAMDNAEVRDETLTEVNHGLKVKYHSSLKILSFATGLTILICFLIVWLNGYNISMNYLIVTGLLLISFTTIKTLLFVLDMIDPEKRKKIALDLIAKAYPHYEGDIKTGDFITLFISLERIVRDYIEKNRIPIKNKNYWNAYPSYKDMIETLRANEIIMLDNYEQLLELGKYRNLVVHGHISKVSAEKYEQLEVAHSVLKKIYDENR